MEDPVSRPFLDNIGLSYGIDHEATEIAMQVACTMIVLMCGWLLMKWHRRGSEDAAHKTAAE
jgi:hypothetical protein